MTNHQIKKILISKGVNGLYHSNTVETSLSFLKAGGLISRGVCEDLGYPQTPQKSDQLDKDFDIYYDLFFDSVDIHERAHNANYYGPVLFEYDISVLDSIPEGCIRITKSNPVDWNVNASENERYFTNDCELGFCFTKGDFGQHITIKAQNAPLPFIYLRRIIITNPCNDYMNYYANAVKAINQSISDNNLDIVLVERDCPDYCKCFNFYSNNYNVKNHYKLGGNQ
jgi:hypothetical protein